MKILIVSNLYPPHHIGGYELRCSQVAEYLFSAGHEVRVLTSSYRRKDSNLFDRDGENVGNVPVIRVLRHYKLDFQPGRHFYTLSFGRSQLLDVRRFMEVLDEFRPEIVNWWNLEGITKAILPIPISRGIPDLHCVADTWMIREYGVCGESDSLFWFQFWRGSWGPSFLRPVLRRIVAQWAKRVRDQGIITHPFPNTPRHVWFVSEFMRFEHAKAGFLFPSSEVIYSGISSDRFYLERSPLDFQRKGLRFLFVGYVEPNRGLHVIVDALGLIPPDLQGNFELSIVPIGPPKPGRYVEEIKAQICKLGLSKKVTFLGTKGHEEMPAIYKDHHVLISASTRPEGLPLSMMEAMCAGCAVITTGSGGAAELADRADLPIFPKDHPVALSRLIAKLVRDRGLVFEIGNRGQRVVLQDFTFSRMVAEFHDRLHALRGRNEEHGNWHIRPTGKDTILKLRG